MVLASILSATSRAKNMATDRAIMDATETADSLREVGCAGAQRPATLVFVSQLKTESAGTWLLGMRAAGGA